MSEFGVTTPEEYATQAIRDYCEWHVSPVLEETIILDGSGTDTVLLPSRRVLDILSITVNGSELEADAFEWSQIGALRRLNGSWPDRYRSIHVKLSHGYENAGVLASIVSAVAARIEIDPTGMITNQRAGTQSVSFGGRVAQGGGGHGLLSSEKEQLAAYKLNWGP